MKLRPKILSLVIGILLVAFVALSIPLYWYARSALEDELDKRLASTALEILGLHGQLMPESKYAPMGGMAAHSYLGSKGHSLQGGTSEILKNIIAQRGLGLPRGA